MCACMCLCLCVCVCPFNTNISGSNAIKASYSPIHTPQLKENTPFYNRHQRSKDQAPKKHMMANINAKSSHWNYIFLYFVCESNGNNTLLSFVIMALWLYNSHIPFDLPIHFFLSPLPVKRMKQQSNDSPKIQAPIKFALRFPRALSFC